MSEIRIMNLCHKKSILVDIYRQSLLNRLWGKISIPHKLGFSEISPQQSLLPSNAQIIKC